MTGTSSRFSPRSLAPDQLEALTVGRAELLDHVADSLTGAVVSGQARFDLLLGPRGAGKSHVIGLLESRLRGSAQLADRCVVVAPPEELHTTSLLALLAELLRAMPDDPELGSTLPLVRSLQRQRDGDAEARAVELIRTRLRGRAMLVMLENLDEHFDALGRQGQLRLRNILQTERRWSILASSRALIPAFTKYEAPFHGTFNLHELAPLSAEECRAMLSKLAHAHGQVPLAELLDSPKGLARVRGIRHLLGGNPRAMAFMFRHLDAHRLDHFELALAELADELKPYFQEQLNRVSRGQAAILEVLADNWRPLKVSDIAEQTFTKPASTSTALRHLRRDGLVHSLELGRERYYELGDPLHRLARANERPGEAIAAFARVIRWWYADEDTSDFQFRQEYVLPEEEARLPRFAAERVVGPAADQDLLARAPAGRFSAVLAFLSDQHEMTWGDSAGRSFGAPTESRLEACCVAVYTWLASRRPLAPLAELAPRVSRWHELVLFPAAILESQTPQEAFTRLSAEERAFVQQLLTYHRDDAGLAYFGLTPSP